MAHAGASVAILARNEDKNDRVLQELKAIGRPAAAFHLDVTKRATLATAVAAVEHSLGSVGAAIFLASQAADFITGVTLPVDGGYSIS